MKSSLEMRINDWELSVDWIEIADVLVEALQLEPTEYVEVVECAVQRLYDLSQISAQEPPHEYARTMRELIREAEA
jgi:hypothetical protein